MLSQFLKTSKSFASFGKSHLLAIVFSILVSAISEVGLAVITNGQNATNILGSFNSHSSSASPNYTKATPDNGGSPLGLEAPTFMALDSTNHRLFVSDSTNNRVLVYNLDASNNLSDGIADNVIGISNFSAVSSGASQSRLAGPQGLAYDSANNRLFVADRINHRVMVFDVTSITNGENAVGVLGQANYTATSAATTQAGLSLPQGLLYDSANSRLYVSEIGNHRIVVYDVASITNGENSVNVLGQTVFTTGSSGTTASTLSSPAGMALDSTNNRLFVADTGNSRVLVFDVATLTDGESAVNVLGPSNFTTGTGATSQSRLYNPDSVAYNSTSNLLFVGDQANARVMIFDVTSITNGENAVNMLGSIDFTSSSGSTTQGTFAGAGICVLYDSGNTRLYASDKGNNRILIFDLASISDGENAVGLLGQFNSHSSSSTPIYTKSTAHNGPSPLGLKSPHSIAIDPVGHRLFVSDAGNNRILIHNLSTTNNIVDGIADNVLGQPDFSSQASAVTQSGLNGPRGLAYDSTNKRLFVADSQNNRILIYDVTNITDGENAVNVLGQTNFTTNSSSAAQNKVSVPTGLFYSGATNKLFVADAGYNRVLIFDVASITDGENAINVLGQTNFTNSSTAVTQSRMNSPKAVAFDDTTKYLFVADRNNNRVLIFDLNATTDGENAINVFGQTTFTSNSNATTQSGFYGPEGLALDIDNRRLFVVENGQSRVTVFNISSIADGQNATHVLGPANFTSITTGANQTRFSAPVGAAFDPGTQLLYIGDNSNNRVMIHDATGEMNNVFFFLNPE